jgi:outer membrane protein
MLKLFCIAVLLVGSGLPIAASATDTAMAVVNFSRLQSEAPQSISARERIEQEFASRQARIEEQAVQIAQLENQLLEASMGEVERKSLQRDIRSRNLRLENAREELQNDRRVRASEESDRLRRIVAEVIADVAAREGVDVVLEVGVVAWSSERADITELVLTRLRELDAARN